MRKLTTKRAKHDKENPYTMISHVVYTDDRLNAEEIGAMTVLLSLPTEKRPWDLCLVYLRNRLKMGEVKIKMVLKNLENYGYLERTQTRKDGRLSDEIYILHENPPLYNNCTTETVATETVVQKSATTITIESSTIVPSTLALAKDKDNAAIFSTSKFSNSKTEREESINLISDSLKVGVEFASEVLEEQIGYLDYIGTEPIYKMIANNISVLKPEQKERYLFFLLWRESYKKENSHYPLRDFNPNRFISKISKITREQWQNYLLRYPPFKLDKITSNEDLFKKSLNGCLKKMKENNN